MKQKILITAILSMLSAHAIGQPVVTFTAAIGKIKYTTDGTTLISVPTGNPAQIPGFGTLNIALYSAPDGTVLGGSGASLFGPIPDLTGPWKIQTSPLIHQVALLPGFVPAIVVTLDATSGSPGQNVELEAVYWTGNYSTFAQALAGGTGLIAWSGSLASGGAFGWSNPTGDGITTLPLISTGAGAFNGLVSSVPEPSILALGGLGSAALFLFHRRK